MTGTISKTIRGFIIENFLFGDTSCDLADSTSLIENGIVDSTAVLELVAFIEDSFGITMSDSDIVPANLDSIARIAAFVGTRHGTIAA